MQPRSGLWITLGFGVSLSACQLVGGFEDFAAGDGSGGSSGSGGATGGAAGSGGGSGASACPAESDPGLHGAAMVQWKRPDGSCLWVDTTEATVAEYQAFLASSPSAQSGVCAWNATAVDSGAPPASGPAPGLAINETCLGSAPVATLPVTCVDWCDAQAFCLWAGKELCGDSTTALDDATQSDWYAVCSSNDSSAYPYGPNYKGDACNGVDAKQAAPVVPGTFTACAAGEVLDLSGNVSEWTGACSQNTEDGPCQVRGGSYGSAAQQLACAQAEVIARKQTAPTRGFRCCHE